jgi:hypothetical protein
VALCGNFFQSIIDYLTAPPDNPEEVKFLKAYIAVNRAAPKANPYVLYAYSDWVSWQSPVLTGHATQYFSDRVASGAQPFDSHRTDPMVLSITVPDGPISFTRPDNGALIARFSNLECRDNGLVDATSDFSQAIIVVNLVQTNTILF